MGRKHPKGKDLLIVYQEMMESYRWWCRIVNKQVSEIWQDLPEDQKSSGRELNRESVNEP
jgi:hypothetical protein